MKFEHCRFLHSVTDLQKKRTFPPVTAMEGEFLPIKEGKRGSMYHKVDENMWYLMTHKSSKPAFQKDYYECNRYKM